MRPKTPRATPFLDPSKVSERQFQDVVVRYARACGWLVHHSRPAMNRRGEWSTPIQGDAGFPDLVLARDGTVLILELKSQKGRVPPEQHAWHSAMGMMDVAVWRPSDWPELSEVLQ